MISLFLPELCLQRYLYPVDTHLLPGSYGQGTHHILPIPPSQVLGPSSGQERGEAMKEEDHAIHCLPDVLIVHTSQILGS